MGAGAALKSLPEVCPADPPWKSQGSCEICPVGTGIGITNFPSFWATGKELLRGVSRIIRKNSTTPSGLPSVRRKEFRVVG